MIATSDLQGSHRPLFLLLLVFSVAVITGCGEESPTGGLTGIPEVTGAFVPETTEAGEVIEVEIWGRLPHDGWGIERFDVDLNRDGMVTITPIGSRNGARNSDGAASFRETARIETADEGTHTIRIRGADGDHDFPIYVYPRHVMVRLLVRGGPDHVHEELAIHADGRTMAFRRGEGRPVRLSIPTEQVDEVRGLFRAARFFDLEHRYIDEEPNRGLFYHIGFHTADQNKMILAEETAAPPELLRLVGHLRRLIDRIVNSSPEQPLIHGEVRVEPARGGQDVERRLTLTLVNRSDETRTLRFADGQSYDIVIFSVHRGDHPDWGSDRPERLIWNWAFDKDFIQVETELAFRPGQELSFEETWSCVANDGGPVPDGIYQVAGIVTGHPEIPIRHAEVAVGTTDPPPPPPRLTLDLTAEPVSAPPRTPRVLLLTVSNRTREAVTLHYPDNQHYDFHVDDPRRLAPMPLWSWSFGRGFTDFPTTLTIPPGEHVRFEESWPGTTNEGETAGPGVYHVSAVLTTGEPMPAAMTRIQVTER